MMNRQGITFDFFLCLYSPMHLQVIGAPGSKIFRFMTINWHVMTHKTAKKPACIQRFV